MNESSQQIERDVERSRANLSETVEAIKDKMSTGQILDEATKLFRDSGGGEIASKIMSRVTGNPIPLAMVGIGLAWLMANSGQSASSGNGRELHANGNGLDSTHANGLIDGVRDVAEGIGEGVSGVGAKVSRSAHDFADGVGHKASNFGHKASDITANVSHSAAAAAQSLSRMFEAEPLILGAIGVAVGAAIGSVLPATAVEDRYMGKARDAVKSKVGDLASTAVHEIKDAATA